MSVPPQPILDRLQWFEQRIAGWSSSAALIGLTPAQCTSIAALISNARKAYDDVDNFSNKFTANYLFLINQTESEIPKVNQPSLDRLKHLNTEWAALKARASEILDKDIPSLNKRLWEAGLGAIWKD